MVYLIAYLDRNENGFVHAEPWIKDEVDSYEDGAQQREQLKNDGFREVILFAVECEDEIPESVTWNFVMEHRLI